MNDNGHIPNPALRAHVQSHSFVFTLKPTHIKWLERIAHSDRGPSKMGRERPFRFAERDDFVTGMNGCVSRGLVEYRAERGFMPNKPRQLGKDPIHRHYRLTRAGWAALDLLAEAGMVDAIDRRSPARRRVA